MWLHAKSHLSVWRATIWPGAMVSFVPFLSLHLLKQRQQRCFTGCLTNKLTTVLCCKGSGCLSTICCKLGVPPQKHAPWQSEDNLLGFLLLLHGTIFLIKTESKKTEQQILQMLCRVLSHPTLPYFLHTNYKQESGQLFSTLILCVAKPRAVMFQPSKPCKE